MKVYNQDKNVYDASIERLDYIFENFDRIYLSFSGGKDSGVMLNLVLDYMRERGITKKIGLMTLDNEANYNYSLQFMHRIIQANLDLLEVYWCCLPITLPCTVSSYMTEWQCWGVEDEERWIKPMPTDEYVVNIDNCPFDFFEENMNYDEFWDKFGDWYAQGEKCCCMIGIRSDESLNRFRTIMNKKKVMLDGHCWTKKNTKLVYNCYPIYDWTTDDIWVANAKFDWDYNELYDIFWKSGMSVAQMRVASPFMSESKSSLNMYRIIDAEIWSRLCARVQGANFVATYGKQLTYRSFKLPEGHTWKSFTKFLLDTLPKEVAVNFKMRFIQSIKYWWRVGRGLPNEVIEDLDQNGIWFKLRGKTAHGNKDKWRVSMLPPDHLDMLKTHPSEVTSWKRFAITILKNDHTCKYLGLAPTKEQAVRQREIMKKYKNI
ncbi:phosphoadenosine phosphosulfate sulfurtransferase [Candidatus Bathyarchaeota archaeon]|nr:MAG: phosphoadenosine phosphosulfate sulfurtransferase [Candidatus Bathyarchaeota archaeon]